MLTSHLQGNTIQVEGSKLQGYVTILGLKRQGI